MLGAKDNPALREHRGHRTGEAQRRQIRRLGNWPQLGVQGRASGAQMSSWVFARAPGHCWLPHRPRGARGRKGPSWVPFTGKDAEAQGTRPLPRLNEELGPGPEALSCGPQDSLPSPACPLALSSLAEGPPASPSALSPRLGEAVLRGLSHSLVLTLMPGDMTSQSRSPEHTTRSLLPHPGPCPWPWTQTPGLHHLCRVPGSGLPRSKCLRELQAPHWP